MKATGIVRRIDELGRVVLPKELRKTMGIEPGDALEIFVTGKDIILQKYEAGCHFCGGAENLSRVGDMLVCKECKKQLASEL